MLNVSAFSNLVKPKTILISEPHVSSYTVSRPEKTDDLDKSREKSLTPGLRPHLGISNTFQHLTSNISQHSNYKRGGGHSSVSPTRSAMGLASLNNPNFIEQMQQDHRIFEMDEIQRLKKEFRQKENEYETKIAL